MKINLLETIKNGKMGDLRLGMSEAATIALLGEPETRSRKSRPLKILRYGSAQLHFSADHLVIASIHLDRCRPWPTIELTGWVPPIGISRDEFVDHLTACRIMYRQADAHDDTILITEGNAIISFVQGELDVVGIEDRSIRKQIGARQ